MNQPSTLEITHHDSIVMRSARFQDADHLSVLKAWEGGEIDAEDFSSMAGVLGYTLGSSHRRGETAAGGSAAAVLERDLAGSAEILLSEILETSASDDLALQRDYLLFQALLDDHGPLLGAEQIASDLP